MEANDILDWSGRTTYWQQQVKVTQAGARALAQELTAAFADLRILDLVFDSSYRRRFVPRPSIDAPYDCTVFGACVENAPALATWLAAEHAPLVGIDASFTGHLSLQMPRAFPPRSVRPPGRSEVPDANLEGWIRTRFFTRDESRRALAHELIAAVQRCFSAWVEEVDVATGRVLGVKAIAWYSNDLRAWCSERPHRYLSITQDSEKRHIGLRPCDPPR